MFNADVTDRQHYVQQDPTAQNWLLIFTDSEEQ